ncbi:kinase-like domain-containing protein [Scenedesmus sp. NREL 46B-D3]|nr:kinase-like domain-containing protein [Scenedesmus sp. NREL 46B-D3]
MATTSRCAGFSTLEGAVSVCLPAFAPDESHLAAAGAEVAAKSPVPVKVQHAAAGDSLYFVTVKLHAGARSSASTASTSSNISCSSNASSMWTSPANAQPAGAVLHPNAGMPNAAAGHRLSLSTCLYPQFDSGGAEDVAASDGFSDQSLDSVGSVGCGYSQNPGRLVVISSVGPDSAASAEAAAAAAAEARADGSGSSCSSSGSLCGDPHSNTSLRLIAQGSSSSGSSGSLEALGGGLSSVCAGLVCKRIAGLALGGQIAAGSYGRVYRGDYFGSKVAVKVLDGHAVLRRDETTGFCLEALLSEQLKHPNIMRALAWAVVTGEGKLPARQQVWGETLDPDKPSVDAIAAAVASGKAGSGAAAAAAAGGGATNTITDTVTRRANPNPYDKLMQLGSPGPRAAGGVTDGVSGSSADMAARRLADTWEDEEAARDEDVTAGQTWMVLEYCDRGCLQDAVERGWLRESRSCVSGPVSLLAVLATAAEIASGMALLHSNGIIHGDLSAFNVMLSSADPAAAIGDRGFVAKVADFGLSRTLTHGSKVVTKTYGTITHMPPETLEHGVAGKAADVYSFGVLLWQAADGCSFGVLLWQMVTGSRAWAGLSHMGVVNAVCCNRQQLQFPGDAPDALVMLGVACMAHDPAERPTFQDVLDILEPLNDVILGRSGGGAGGGGTSGDAAGCGGRAHVAALQGGMAVDVESF